MGTHMKNLARPFAVLFGMALIIAVLARIGLAIMAQTGSLAFDYISASGVAVLDVICSILTGSAFVAFLFAASLVLAVSTAGSVLYAVACAKGVREGACESAARPAGAFLWGWATALVAIICLVIVALGILSAVQVGSMSSKLPAMPVLVIAMIVFAAFIGTLLGAASMALYACLMRSKAGASFAKSVLGTTTICGAVVMLLTIGTFSAINTTSPSLGTVGAWFALDIVANLAILFVSDRRAKKALS